MDVSSLLSISHFSRPWFYHFFSFSKIYPPGPFFLSHTSFTVPKTFYFPSSFHQNSPFRTHRMGVWDEIHDYTDTYIRLSYETLSILRRPAI